MARIAVVGLAGDSGCQIACVGLHEKLIDILTENELVYAPTLVDAKDFPHADVSIIEGGIRTRHEEETAKRVRMRSKVVVTIGSCACFGGIPGLANLGRGEDLLKNVYGGLKGTVGGVIPEHDEVVPHVKPVDAVVKVDYMVPGCPPEVSDIAYALTTLLKGETPEPSKTDVCDDCPKKRIGEYSKKLKRIHEENADPERCLLEQGFLCIGPATRGGCGAPCPTAGAPCDGCRGPTEKNDDQGLTMIDALMNLISGASSEFSLSRDSAAIYRYTFASSRLGRLINRMKMTAVRVRTPTLKRRSRYSYAE